MNPFFKLEKRMLDSPEMGNLINRNQFDFIINLINDRFASQVQSIEDRTQLIMENLITTKELILDYFPKELLEMPVERFCEDYEGNFEQALKEIIHKIPVSQKQAIINDKNINCKIQNKPQSPLPLHTFKEGIWSGNSSAKIIRTPLFSKKKNEVFIESGNTDKSGKRPWVP